MARCEDCGAVVDGASCSELFSDLLALDHSRRAPWGPLHGVVTAAYLLQHPADPRSGSAAALLPLVETYLHGGQAALSAMTERARRGNRAGRPGPSGREREATEPATRSSGRATVTIHDVAVDGTFPAAGHEERVPPVGRLSRRDPRLVAGALTVRR